MQSPEDIKGWLDRQDQEEKKKHLNPHQFGGPLMAGGYPNGLAAGWMFQRPPAAQTEIIAAPNGTPETSGPSGYSGPTMSAAPSGE